MVKDQQNDSGNVIFQTISRKATMTLVLHVTQPPVKDAGLKGGATMTYEKWEKSNKVESLIKVLLRSAYNKGRSDAENEYCPDFKPDDIDLERRKAETQ